MKPKISYVVCAVQRSGSSLLCEALKNTGLAGVPEEYFLYHENDGNWEDGEWAKRYDVKTRQGFLDLVLEKGSSENGVFGTKLMWNYFPRVLQAFAELPDHQSLTPFSLMAAMLGDPQYIWIVRRDKVRQAVSWAIAAQSGLYASWHGSIEDHLDKLAFDFDFISGLRRLIHEGENGWQDYFDSTNVIPYKVYYEDFIEDYEGAALEILDFLGVEYPYDLQFSERTLERQATRINDQWVEKYRKLDR